MKNRKQQQLERDNEKILSVVSFWQRRVAWWNEDVTSPEHSEPQIQHHFQFGFFKPDVHQVAPKDVIDLKQADLNDALRQKIVEDEEEETRKAIEKQQQIEMPHLEEVVQEQDMIAARDDEIRLIEQDVKKLNEMFRDINQLVIEQGSMIDRIESNIDTSAIDLGYDKFAAPPPPEEATWGFEDDLDIPHSHKEFAYADPFADLTTAAAATAPPPLSPTYKREYTKDEKPKSEDENVGAFGLFSDEDDSGGGALFGEPVPASYSDAPSNPFFDRPTPSLSSSSSFLDFNAPVPEIAAAPVVPPSYAAQDVSYIDESFTGKYSNDSIGPLLNSYIASYDAFDGDSEKMDNGASFEGFTYQPEPKPAPEPEPVFDKISKNEMKKKAKNLATG